MIIAEKSKEIVLIRGEQCGVGFPSFDKRSSLAKYCLSVSSIQDWLPASTSYPGTALVRTWGVTACASG